MHIQEPSHAEKSSEHWRINISVFGILVIPHFRVHRITRFDQSSRLTALFSIRAQPDLHDIRSGGKIRSLTRPPPSPLSPISNEFTQSDVRLCINSAYFIQSSVSISLSRKNNDIEMYTKVFRPERLKIGELFSTRNYQIHLPCIIFISARLPILSFLS